jgi:hypothetical protein
MSTETAQRKSDAPKRSNFTVRPTSSSGVHKTNYLSPAVKRSKNDMIKRERGGIGHISDVNMAECWYLGMPGCGAVCQRAAVGDWQTMVVFIQFEDASYSQTQKPWAEQQAKEQESEIVCPGSGEEGGLHEVAVSACWTLLLVLFRSRWLLSPMQFAGLGLLFVIHCL